MNFTSKNIELALYVRWYRSSGLYVRNIFASFFSFILLSFFAVRVHAQYINNHKRDVINKNQETVNKNSDASKTAAVITSTGTGGLWSVGSTWSGGVVPTSGDDVTIAAGATVTVDVNTATCLNITIAGTLTFNAGINLDVNSNWTNNGVLTAGTGSVTYKGATNNSISGSSPSAFYNIILDKGTNVTSILEANGVGALSNTGNITITNGLFKMTTGTFQFNAAPTIPSTGGIWVNGATLNGGNFSTTFNGLLRLTGGVHCT